MAEPTVTTATVNAPASIPEGTKVTCVVSGSSFDPVKCPILEYGGYTYWALSYVNNSVAMCIVAYDKDGNIAKQWDKDGARYLWKIDVNDDKQTVVFWGQGDDTITMTWDELRVS